MMTPQKPRGTMAQAKVKVMVAQKALTLAASEMDPSSKEFQACVKAAMDLAKVFGKNEEESQSLMPAEVMQVMQGAAGPGAAPKPPGAAPPPGAGAPPPMQ
jgi:hypothetical protein